MSNKVKTTPKQELAVIKREDSMMDILRRFDIAIKEQDELINKPFVTTGELEGFGKLKDQTDVPTLIKAYGSVMAREEIYSAAAKELGIESIPEFIISGGTREQWKQDIQLRINIVQKEENLKVLKSLREEAKGFISKEEQKEDFFNRMNKFAEKL